MLHNINKIVHIGRREGMEIFCKIEFKDGKLSITGVEGPKSNGNAQGSAGQIIMTYKEYNPRGYASISDIEPAPGWDTSTIKKFFDIWDNYHLNDMQAGCEHQRKLWDPTEKITVSPLHPTSKYWRESDRAKDGQMTPEEYQIWGDIVQACEAAWLHDKTRVSHPDFFKGNTKTMIEWGYLEVDQKKIEVKSAGLVYPTEHPKGLLTKPCPKCGYKYGTKWLKMEVPATVHARLYRFPDTDITPAWV